MARLVRDARSLSANEAWTVAGLAAVAVALPLLQRLLSLPALIGLLDSRRPRPAAATDPAAAVRLVDGLLGVRLGPLRPGCVRRSLLLFALLRRRGQPVTILYGLRPDTSRLEGHSWLELGGQAVGEVGDPRHTFRVTYAYPPAPPPHGALKP